MPKTDYKALCQTLFGTTNVEELKIIAGRLQQTNPRNAGRKRKFTPEEVAAMRQLQAAGITMTDLARRYGTSRQIIGKYLNQPLEENYTMRLTLMYKNKRCTEIDVDLLEEKIRIRNFTDDLIHRAFGVVEEPTWEDFQTFLQGRCFPKTRGNAKKLLEQLDLQDYDPLQIVEKTAGRTAEDDLWIKFQYTERTGVPA